MLIDFRKFFDNVRHDKLIELYENMFPEKEFIEFLTKIIKPYEIDTDGTIDDVYDSIKDKGGKNHVRKSIGIGAPFSQITGLYFPSQIDTYCKTVKGLKYYGAYADDRYVIHTDKKYLKKLLEEIKEIAERLGIYVHPNKTQIIKLSHGFTFLKTKYILTETGKLIRKIPIDSITRQRRKMKKLVNQLSKVDFENWYKSWRGDKKNYDAYNTLKNIDGLYWRLLNGDIF